jgi:hypothetical protein
MWPMLLDTSALQHVRYVSEFLGGAYMSDDDEDELLRRFGLTLGAELAALGDLISVLRYNGPQWLTSETSLLEFARVTDEKGRELLDWWRQWAHYMQGCIDADWYPAIAIEQLTIQRGPEVSEDQLALPIAPPRSLLTDDAVPAIGPFRDAGDRALIHDAVRAGIPTILTTDIRSFWRHRAYLRPIGIAVLRPTEVAASVAPRSRVLQAS